MSLTFTTLDPTHIATTSFLPIAWKILLSYARLIFEHENFFRVLNFCWILEPISMQQPLNSMIIIIIIIYFYFFFHSWFRDHFITINIWLYHNHIYNTEWNTTNPKWKWWQFFLLSSIVRWKINFPKNKWNENS